MDAARNSAARVLRDRQSAPRLRGREQTTTPPYGRDDGGVKRRPREDLMDSVEEIVAVMRATGNDPEGMRLREADGYRPNGAETPSPYNGEQRKRGHDE